MMMNSAGSTLTEYALIAALVSIVVLAVGRDMRFPGAPVVALSEVASGPRELGSPGLGSESRAHRQGGRSFAGKASGSGFLQGAGASGTAQGRWVGSTAKASPRPRDPEPPDPALFDMDAAKAATFAQLDGPTEGARSAGPGEGTAGWRGRPSGDRSTGGGKAAGIRLVSPRRPARRLDPAVEQLVSLGPGSEAEALTAERASFDGTAGTARGETAGEIRTRATSGFNRHQPARPTEARATVVTGTFRMGDHRLWALVVLMLVGLGLGAHRLARRLQSMARRARNP